jgi:hypothetical protein
MEDMRRNASKSVQEKPWLLAVAGLAVGLFCFATVAGARVLSHLAPKLGNLRPVTIQLTPVPPSCEGPSLTLGAARFEVQFFVPAGEGLAAPAR